MEGGEPHIVLELDTKRPMELGAFLGAFNALANEFERYVKKAHPDLPGEPQLYVEKVREGSVIVDLVPWLAVMAPFIGDMEKIMVVDKFVRLWAGRFRALQGTRSKEPAPATRSELKDWADAVAAIANDENGSARLTACAFEDGKKKIRAAFQFKTKQARKVREAVEKRQRELEKKEHADHTRVLMRFTRSDVGDVNVGKPSGERVVIEEISDRRLALIYASQLAEQRIKHVIREGEDNVYKKGFVVDVNVRSSGGRPVAYAVTNIHQVIDLPD